MSGPALVVDDLRVRYAGTAEDALAGVSLRVDAGECVAVVGASGSGKSTLARAVLGLLDPDAIVEASELRVTGTDVRGLRERDWNRLRGRRVGFVLQDALSSLDPLRPIGREVADAAVAHRLVRRGDRRALVGRLLADAHAAELVDRLDARPHELSGGQRQRALIASALAADPPLLVADEPSASLDRAARDGILRLLAERRDAGGAVLLITHDLAAVEAVADRVVVVHGGRIVDAGSAVGLLAGPAHPATSALVDAARPALPRAAPPPGGPAVLEFDEVSYAHPGGGRGVTDVGFALAAGEAVGIVGPSGAGKSTIARLALGYAEPDSGVVRLHGQAWSGRAESARRPRRSRIQLVHQDTVDPFDPRWTVRRLLDEAMAAAGVPAVARSARRVDLLGRVGLPPGLEGRRAAQLSGGQRQRLALARALATEPDVLVCDEAVSALDPVNRAAVLRLLDRLRRETGVAILLISHDPAAVAALCSRVLEVRDGRLHDPAAGAPTGEASSSPGASPSPGATSASGASPSPGASRSEPVAAPTG
ncbi:ABC transporter ATP-binding protein [Agromyces sp. MMS24-JH15]|uniref:ABC transporter ATP-binding protein n=1 Tax=Agromyces sp. MMS24-JH15 TaxID=3243765 RepID=UPI003748E35F